MTRGWKWPRRLSTGLLAFAVVGSVSLLGSVPPTSAASEGLSILGAIEEPSNTFTSSFQLIQALPSREMVGAYIDNATPNQQHLPIYNMASAVPKLIKDFDLGPHSQFGTLTWSPTTTTVDTKRNILLLLSWPSQYGGTKLIRVDLKHKRLLSEWSLREKIPGFLAHALTYSPEDDRIYLFGEWSGDSALSERGALVFAGRPLVIAGAAALDAASTDVSVPWTRIVRQCPAPLSHVESGSLIVRPHDQVALYFPCYKEQGSMNLSSLVRLWISPKAAQSDADKFRVDNFVISGQYYTVGQGGHGTIAFDPVSDRIFLQSLSETTPAAWVFDGRSSKWVGSIATPAPGAYLGVNPYTGHVFVSGSSQQRGIGSFLIVADGRATPAPQGELLDTPAVDGAQKVLLADPYSSRMFLPVTDLGKYGAGPAKRGGLLVVKDNLSLARASGIDYDSLTTDVPEGTNTDAEFDGAVGGFGSRVLLTGGYGGIASQASSQATQISLVGPLLRTGVSPGDRGFFAGYVGGIDLRNVGATAAAQALAPDTLTDDERGGKQQTVGEAPSDSAASVGQTADQRTGYQHGFSDTARKEAAPYDESTKDAREAAASQLDWPWAPVTCLDAGGNPQQPPLAKDPAGLGRASASCNLSTAKSSASSTFGPLSTKAGGVDVSIAYSSFTTDVYRDTKLGMVTKSTALAKGVHLTVPGAGGLSIGVVEAVASTLAHGRPGTTRWTYENTFDQVRLTDATGKTIKWCPSDCDLKDIIDGANQQFESRVRLEFPKPDSDATPRGAFAGIQKSDADYYNDLTTNNDASRSVPAVQLTILNDGLEKSRVVIQLAAIQASSIYGISLLPTDSPFGSFQPPTPFIPPPVPGPAGGGQGLGGPPPAGNGQAPGGFVTRAIRQALLLVHSPRQMLLASLLWGMFAGAGVLTARRRKLIELLERKA